MNKRKILIGLIICIISFGIACILLCTAEPTYVVLFAPYRTEREFEGLIPSKRFRIASRLTEISRQEEVWHLVVVSKLGGLKAFSLNTINIEVSTNKPIIILRER